MTSRVAISGRALARRSFIGTASLLTALSAFSAPGTADDGFWVLKEVKLWPYSAQANPPPPRPNKYEQDVKAQGIRFTVITTDPDNKAHPHHVWMGWTIAGENGVALVKPGGDLKIEVKGSHSGDAYRSADFSVRAGDWPRENPPGWKSQDATYPTWTYKTDPVLFVEASNNEAKGEKTIRFPGRAKPDSEPYTLLFSTGVTATAGVEYIYKWSESAPKEEERIKLPVEVIGK